MINAIVTAETNERIVERIQAGDAEALDTLCAANRGLVAHVAKRYAAELNSRGDCDTDDLMQAGFIGVFLAATLYTPDRGAKFSTYAVFYIRREMRRTLGLLTSKRDAGRGATSLDAPLYSDNDELTLLDTLVDNEAEDINGRIEREELKAAVRSAVGRIRNNKNRRAIEAYYFLEKSTEQQAEEDGVSVQNISKRLNKGHLELYRDAKLSRWAVDYEHTNIYRYKGVRSFKSSFSSVVEDIIIQAEERQTERNKKRVALQEILGTLM